MYIQINDKAPVAEQIRQLKTQLEIILDDLTVQAETATSEPVIPSIATDIGKVGDICSDENYIYVCVGTNTWKRTLISTW